MVYFGHTLEGDGGADRYFYPIIDKDTVYDFDVSYLKGNIEAAALSSQLLKKYSWYRTDRIEWERLPQGEGSVLVHTEDINGYRHEFYFSTNFNKLINIATNNQAAEFEDLDETACKEWFFTKFPDKFTPVEVIGELL